MIETINGLLSVKPGNEPQQGETRTFVIEHRPARNGKKAWIKIKGAGENYGGAPYRILSVEPTGFTDTHGNISFNVEIEKSLSNGGASHGIKSGADAPGKTGERQTSEANISAARRDDPPPQTMSGQHEYGPRGDLTQIDQRDIPSAGDDFPKSSYQLDTERGINEARQRIMQDANLMLFAMEGARYVAQQWKERHDCELPNEQFQAMCHCFFIEVSSRRTTDGVNWWSYVDRMPTKPVQNGNEKVERPPGNQEKETSPAYEHGWGEDQTDQPPF